MKNLLKSIPWADIGMGLAFLGTLIVVLFVLAVLLMFAFTHLGF